MTEKNIQVYIEELCFSCSLLLIYDRTLVAWNFSSLQRATCTQDYIIK